VTNSRAIKRVQEWFRLFVVLLTSGFSRPDVVPLSCAYAASSMMLCQRHKQKRWTEHRRGFDGTREGGELGTPTYRSCVYRLGVAAGKTRVSAAGQGVRYAQM